MIMKSRNKRNLRNIFLVFYRFETDVKTSPQTRERTSTRERIHSETILNIYPVDTSTILTGSQDRV
jgi:hypothetical protein